MRRLDRYVLSEVVPAFLLGIGLFAAVLVSYLVYQALTEMARKGLPIAVMLQFILYQLPQMVALTLPMATMFAGLTSMARMSSDGEITAIRAGGIGLPRISVSLVAFGLLVSLVGLGFNELVVPYCNWQSDLVMKNVAQSLQWENIKFDIPKDGPLKRSVYIRHYDAGKQQLENVTVVEYRDDPFPIIIFAKRATWVGGEWTLRDVQTQRVSSRSGTVETAFVKEATYPIGKSPGEVASIENDTEDMTLGELQALVAAREASLRAEKIPPNSDEYRRLYLKQVVSPILEINLRLALPFSAFGFALMAAPLGLRPQRTSKSLGFGLSLVVVFAYYVVFQILRVVGMQGALPAPVAAWAGNVLLFMVGLGLMIDKSR